MTSLFPVMTSIDPLIEAISGMPEIGFREIPDLGYGYIMYQVNFEETFAAPALAKTPEEYARRVLIREARGVKYDLETRQIIQRPYHKFFNLGEKPETQPYEIDWSRPHVILEKLDGSMIIPMVTSKVHGLLWTTKRGVSGVSETTADFLKANPHYVVFAFDMIERGLTPIFEWCTTRQRIILEYAVDRLVLTGVRNNLTGEYLVYDDMHELANTNNIDVVKKLPWIVTDIDAFIKHTRDLRGEEGYVVRFDDGSMYKMKGDWYGNLHKILDQMKFEKDVIRLILTGAVDDAKPILQPALYKAVIDFETAMHDALKARASDILWEVRASYDNFNRSKKKFAEYVMQSVSLKPFAVFLFKAWDRESTFEEIYEHLLSEMVDATNSQTKVNNARFIINGLKWTDYLEPTGDME